ncbi:putative 3-5 exonuclease [Melia azedarach]|uniref:3-5 exonuclease n=1 Tax=Melia azedarach TaxID=155640 RepID=A0ACC1YS96_MELAZ|nr:putative 3-5 exonuclease [Melia azedarach]
MDCKVPKPLKVNLVWSTDSPEFTHLSWALTQSSLIGVDAEWKPIRSHQSDFPTVTLLQLACQLGPRLNSESGELNELDESVVFLVDLSLIPPSSIWELLKEVFDSPDVLKLGFKFKQDLVYLSSTFCSQGCESGFERLEPYLDITSIYNHLHHKHLGRKLPRETKSLATICKEVLGISLSKELQCSDWSHRPLTEEQINYAARDAHCLLEIFNIFQAKVAQEVFGAGNSCDNISELHSATLDLGLKKILEKPDVRNKNISFKFGEALDIVRATASSPYSQFLSQGVVSRLSCRNTMPMDESLTKIVKKYGEKIILKESDRKPKTSKKKGKRKSSVVVVSREKQFDNFSDWQGPPPWDLSLGGDGCPKFLCDVMVEGLAKHLRCVGIDAAIPRSKKPEPRELIDQASKENRVLLTRDAKLLRHQYLIKNQIYRVKSLLKNEQLREVIETFELKISEDQLMSRCTKCNGRFIQKPLTTEEAVEAAKGFQRIPNCLFDKDLEFWQCMDCNQLYWEVLSVILVLSMLFFFFPF